MSRWFAVGVVLRHPDSGSPIFLPPGSEVPEWAEVGDHVLAPAIDEAEPVVSSAGQEAPPPKAGPGSGRAKWVEFATEHGVDVAPNASREDIIAACEAAGLLLPS